MTVITRSKNKNKMRITVMYKLSSQRLFRNISLPKSWRWVDGYRCSFDCDHPKDDTFEGDKQFKNESIQKIISHLNKRENENYIIEIKTN